MPLDPEIILAKIESGRSESRYQKQENVFSQGDPADSIFYIRTGTVKVAFVSPEGREAVLAVLQAGSFCGEDCLTGQALRGTSVTALDRCVLIRIAKGPFARALHDDPEVSELFISHLLERNLRAQDDMVDQLLHSTEKRLARLLLLLANQGQEDRPHPIVPKINQETLAEMIGASRTHVNFLMNKFRQLGLIEYNGDIKINRSLLELLLREK
jgi:CRP/FNR family cyclic AMP-dependent transcriptional regulator